MSANFADMIHAELRRMRVGRRSRYRPWRLVLGPGGRRHIVYDDTGQSVEAPDVLLDLWDAVVNVWTRSRRRAGKESR